MNDVNVFDIYTDRIRSIPYEQTMLVDLHLLGGLLFLIDSEAPFLRQKALDAIERAITSAQR